MGGREREGEKGEGEGEGGWGLFESEDRGREGGEGGREAGGWGVYDAKREYERTKLLGNDSPFRLMHNENYEVREKGEEGRRVGRRLTLFFFFLQFSPSYPEYFVVPKELTHQELIQVPPFDFLIF